VRQCSRSARRVVLLHKLKRRDWFVTTYAYYPAVYMTNSRRGQKASRIITGGLCTQGATTTRFLSSQRCRGQRNRRLYARFNAHIPSLWRCPTHHSQIRQSSRPHRGPGCCLGSCYRCRLRIRPEISLALSDRPKKDAQVKVPASDPQ
jgi:hypothetical protein